MACETNTQQLASALVRAPKAHHHLPLVPFTIHDLLSRPQLRQSTFTAGLIYLWVLDVPGHTRHTGCAPAGGSWLALSIACSCDAGPPAGTQPVCLVCSHIGTSPERASQRPWLSQGYGPGEVRQSAQSCWSRGRTRRRVQCFPTCLRPSSTAHTPPRTHGLPPHTHVVEIPT
jgi:hypothetical protein